MSYLYHPSRSMSAVEEARIILRKNLLSKVHILRAFKVRNTQRKDPSGSLSYRFPNMSDSRSVEYAPKKPDFDALRARIERVMPVYNLQAPAPESLLQYALPALIKALESVARFHPAVNGRLSA